MGLGEGHEMIVDDLFRHLHDIGVNAGKSSDAGYLTITEAIIGIGQRPLGRQPDQLNGNIVAGKQLNGQQIEVTIQGSGGKGRLDGGVDFEPFLRFGLSANQES
jgi:hypothetical protein